jgi:TRAP-type C4-dicarboxylate transport system substrate-binding protein
MAVLRKLALGLLVSTGLFCSSVAASAAPVAIRYSNWLPANFFLWDDVIRPWLTEIEKVTEGRVRIEVTPKVVGTAASQFDVVRDGLADLSWMVTGYTPGRFPLIEMGELPLLGRDAKALGPAMDTVYRTHLAKHDVFKGVEPLSVLILSPLQLVTKGKKPNSVQDLAGLKIRTGSTVLTDVLKLLNAVPIAKSAAEAYEMLASGTIDGQVTNLNTIPGFNQLDLMDGMYYVPGGLSNAVIIMGLNASKWAQISPEDQKAIRAISGPEFARRAGAAYDTADRAAVEKMRQAGYHMGAATPDQMEKLRDMLKPVEDAWISKAQKAGLPDAAEVLKDFKATVAAADGKS